MFDLPGSIQNWLKNSTPQKKLIVTLIVIVLFCVGVFLMTNNAANDPLSSTPLYMLGVTVKLIGVLLLIVASAIIFRRWVHLGPGGNTVRQMRLLETLRLSPRQTLYLVSLGDQQILIGATDQSINLLSQVDGGFSGGVSLVESHEDQGFETVMQAAAQHEQTDSSAMDN